MVNVIREDLPVAPILKWDEWQKRVLDHSGNITIRAGRQVGKSEVVSEKAVSFALKNGGTTTMVLAASQRQSGLLFEKIRAKLDLLGDIYLDKPTLTRIRLKNGSKIYSLPTGRTGHYIRGYTLDLLIVDEAAFIPQTVWTAIRPMIAVAQKKGMGDMVLLSTPFGKGGFYYDTFTDKNFLQFHISSEDCPRIPKEFLRSEKRKMSKLEYAQEYLGEFVEEYNQFFPTQLIKQCMTFMEWDREKDAIPGASYYIGLDLARYGGDEIATVIVEEFKGKLKAVKTLKRDRVSTTATVGETGVLQQLWGSKRIFTDSGGLGGPVLDQLQEKLGKRLVVGLDNSSKGVRVDGEEKRKKILKEDLYSNTLILMENGKLELINDLDLLRSMKSITFEYTSDGKVRISGKYTHLTEALVRACWCLRDKGHRLYVY